MHKFHKLKCLHSTFVVNIGTHSFSIKFYSLCHCTSTAFVGSLQLANVGGVSPSVMLILHDISVNIILIFPFRTYNNVTAW